MADTSKLTGGIAETLPSGPAVDAVAITPTDVGDDAGGPYRALYVGVAGNVKLKTLGGQSVTFTNVPVGVFPVAWTQLFSTGTTATGMFGLK